MTILHQEYRQQIILQVYDTQSDVFAVCGATLFTRAREDQHPVRYLG